MPGFDGTGPLGRGARTGGGRGNCAPNLNQSQTGNVVYGVGRGGVPYGGGMGRCFGGGRGRYFSALHEGRFRTGNVPNASNHEALESVIDGIRTIVSELSHRLDSLFQATSDKSTTTDEGDK